MEFNIISVTDSYYASLSTEQRKCLRTAQKKKNALERQAEKNIAKFKRKVYANSVQTSNILEQKTLEILNELEYETEVIREQLLYDINLKKPDEGSSNVSEAPYPVDYSLSYTDRYIVVRDYYLSLPDPNGRVKLYLQDEVAKKYLGTYYNSLYNYLLTYC